MISLPALFWGWVATKAFEAFSRRLPPSPEAAPTQTPVPAQPRRSPPPRPVARARRTSAPAGTTPALRVVPASAPAPMTSPPWPQVTPSGLPGFPGPGWEPDSPPPPAVVSRAVALLPTLWRGGEGTFKIEQTAARWIAYRASAMSEGKRGVVAYRLAVPREGAVSPAAASSPGVVPVSTRAAPQASPYALPTLRVGSRGTDVVVLQQRLNIKADGIFGAGTDRAVRAYQRARGLKVDGIVGRDTWTSLLGRAA